MEYIYPYFIYSKSYIQPLHAQDLCTENFCSLATSQQQPEVRQICTVDQREVLCVAPCANCSWDRKDGWACRSCCPEVTRFLFTCEELNVSSNGSFFKCEPSVSYCELAIFVFFRT